MKKLDKKVIKMLWSDEFMVEYMPFITDEEKIKAIKIARGKKRQIERCENRIISFLQSYAYNR